MGTADTSWFLRVACRVASGDVLYRDVFYGAGPIAPYVASLFARVSGGEMIALRVLQLLLFAAIAALVLALLRRAGLDAGMDSRWRIPVFCALVVYGFEPAFSIYNILSTAFLLACMGAVLEWQRGGQARWIWLAGILAGLEVGAKQNVAVLAAIALGVPLLARCKWRALARASAGFTAAVAAVLAGVWISGGWAGFLEYGFTAKGKLLAIAFPLSTTVAQFITA
jgi:4-amino-4-deoxy-L-arabinose transferase-like glycosyltransferase